MSNRIFFRYEEPYFCFIYYDLKNESNKKTIIQNILSIIYLYIIIMYFLKPLTLMWKSQ